MIRAPAIWQRIRSKWRQLLPTTVLICYIAGASVVAVGSGITVDDPMEQFTFRKIVRAAGDLLTGRVAEYRQLQSYGDRYYGIGFDVFAYPFQLVLGNYVSRTSHIDRDTALQLATRPAILVLFGISVIVFYRCLRFFVRERWIALAMSAFYAANPYLIGHAMINVRDSPFMSIYLVCTYLSLRLVKRHFDGDSQSLREIWILAAATATLASVRIPGLMILVQYTFTFLLAGAALSTNPGPRLLNWKNLGNFFGVLFPLLVLSFPAVWLNPIREIVAGLRFVGWFQQSGCTLTWGQCLPAYATPTYVFGWLVVKVPLLILLGIVFVPLAARTLWANPFQRTAYLTVIFGSVYLLAVIIPLRAHLYDETRQLLFIYPLLFLSGLVALYLTARRLSVIAVFSCLALFAWDQARLNPYQYVYFNEFSRFFDVDRLFETDYWGLSSREHARSFEPKARLLLQADCIYTEPLWLYRPFVSPDICVDGLDSVQHSTSRTGFVAAITCSTNRIPVSRNCEPLAVVTRSLPLSNRTLTLSAAYYCRWQ
jgi:hypothetical protein